jgi:hypothetical protein
MSCIQCTFATFPFTNHADDTSVRPSIRYECAIDLACIDV